MNKIRKLPPDLINKIAAGEVVERPASVVKELVENSIDAQATFIKIKIENGGKTKITISDNGVGLSKKQAELAFQPHTTSKLQSIDDLNKINSYGFRGEALASIASVSEVIVQTKPRNQDTATQLILSNGEIAKETTCAHPTGTTITIRNLFTNVPARQKFLKTARTEFNHIRSWLEAQAISRPKIGFKLEHNKKNIFHYPESQTLKQRIRLILGDQADDFIPLSTEKEYFQIHGLISPPQKARKRRRDQYLFVNKRHVENKTVFGAVKQAYQNMLPSNLYPPFVIFLKIRPDLVDVNIHPRKEEVKFVSPSMVFNSIKQAIQKTLTENLQANAPSFHRFPPQQNQRPKQKTYNHNFNFNPSSTKSQSKTPQVSKRPFKTIETEQTPTSIWQLGRLYLIVPQEDHLWIIDQHAAEEKIILNKLINQYQQSIDKGNSQKLLFSQTIKLSNKDQKILKKQTKHLEKIGFEIKINKNQVHLTAIPNILKGKPIENILLGFLDDLSQKEFKQPKELKINPETYHSLATLACRFAVKQGDKLISEKREQIVNQLKQLGKNGATCPHGRPTWIKISIKEMNKMFKRE